MKTHKKQRGYALLVFVALLATAATSVAVKVLNNSNSQIARDQITAAALAQAKDALIGRAVTDNNRPGSFPCPDMITNIVGNVPNDGIADLLSGNDCPSYIGHLPWRTLGLPDINDGSRERLWYALSNNFRDDNSAQPINSDTAGNHSVKSPSDTLITNQAVAIIFSAGDVLATQNRSAANINDATQYLESVNCPGPNCRNNAVAAGPFIAGPILDANGNWLVNDKLIVVQTRDFIPTIEKRVAKELKTQLQTYFAAYNYYPYPAKYDDCNPGHGSDCRGDSTACRGRIPRAEAAGNANWNLSNWIRNNEWYRGIYYSVGSASVQNPATVDCAATLTVTGTGAVRAVFFTPGTPISVNRPSNTLSDYLEDTENRDGWGGAGAKDTYVTPAAQTLDRDRLISLP